jgi:hypothetical protein
MTSPSETIVFVHGMANFATNRGTKLEQEQLLRDGLPCDYGFLGAYDDSGNYAFRGAATEVALIPAVLGALRKRYTTQGAIALSRASAASALLALEIEAQRRFSSALRLRDYAVLIDGRHWRLGLVLLDPSSIQGTPSTGLLSVEDAALRVLTLSTASVGVLKYDEEPRIPWGQPAGQIARLICAAKPAFATGRSARTVRGILRRFRPPPVSSVNQ